MRRAPLVRLYRRMPYRGGGAAAFNTASLALTAYFDSIRGAYVSPTWTGIASAGSSGTRTMVAGAAPPASSGAPDFNGSGHYLIAGGALKFDSFVTRTAYFGQIVFDADTLQAPGANPYQDECLVSDNGGNFYLGASTSGLRYGHYDDVSFKKTSDAGGAGAGYIAISASTKYVAQFWYDGTNLNLRTNTNTTGVAIAAGSFTSSYTALVPRIGENYNDTVWFDGRIRQLILMASVPAAATRDLLLTDAKTLHGIA
jgi:hypothetical protein